VMQYTVREKKPSDADSSLSEALEPLLGGIGMEMIELSVFHGKRGGVQVKAVVMTTGSGVTGVEDCAKAHRLILPRLELAFPRKEIYLEVSSPGIDRLIKDGREFAHYLGREVKCYRVDMSDWTAGILADAGVDGITLLADGSETVLSYETIAKARLSNSAFIDRSRSKNATIKECGD